MKSSDVHVDRPLLSGTAEAAMEMKGVVGRVRQEFLEMPGLQLTPAQAGRLWGLDDASCQSVIEALIASAFLRWTRSGTVMRDVQ